jgi:hypothetical protein
MIVLHKWLVCFQEKFNAMKNDKITRVHEEIAQVKDIMIKNIGMPFVRHIIVRHRYYDSFDDAPIELVLERGERIELLVAKTEELDMRAIQFYRGQLPFTPCWLCYSIPFNLDGLA